MTDDKKIGRGRICRINAMLRSGYSVGAIVSLLNVSRPIVQRILDRWAYYGRQCHHEAKQKGSIA
jgi:hypothetical protein